MENQTLKEWEKLQRFEKIMYLKEKEGWTNGGRGKGAIWRVKKLEKKLEEQPSQITPPGEFTMSMQGVGEVEEQSQQITSPGDITMPIQEGGEVEEQSRQITSPRDITTMSIQEGGEVEEQSQQITSPRDITYYIYSHRPPKKCV